MIEIMTGRDKVRPDDPSIHAGFQGKVADLGSRLGSAPGAGRRPGMLLGRLGHPWRLQLYGGPRGSAGHLCAELHQERVPRLDEFRGADGPSVGRRGRTPRGRCLGELRGCDLPRGSGRSGPLAPLPEGELRQPGVRRRPHAPRGQAVGGGDRVHSRVDRILAGSCGCWRGLFLGRQRGCRRRCGVGCGVGCVQLRWRSVLVRHRADLLRWRMRRRDERQRPLRRLWTSVRGGQDVHFRELRLQWRADRMQRRLRGYPIGFAELWRLRSGLRHGQDLQLRELRLQRRANRVRGQLRGHPDGFGELRRLRAGVRYGQDL